MNIFLMVLTCLNIILVLGLSFTVFLRVKEKKEDQRITKGLQLLQHKIAILQDLSDKADEQVQRLVHMLDTKSNELRRATNEATIAMNSMQNMQQQIAEAPMMTAPAAAQALPAQTNLAPINMDEFNQFVQALNLQNEKAKPAPVMSVHNNLPQEFVPTPEPTPTPAAPNEVRPFEFKRVSKF